MQGEGKGYVRDSQTRGENIALRRSNVKNLKTKTVKFRRGEKKIVREALLEAAKRYKQKILAISVYSNHVHIVAAYVDVPVGALVGFYKNASRVALRKAGFRGRVWTRGYDKRFCFDEESLQKRIEYVQRHDK